MSTFTGKSSFLKLCPHVNSVLRELTQQVVNICLEELLSQVVSGLCSPISSGSYCCPRGHEFDLSPAPCSCGDHEIFSTVILLIPLIQEGLFQFQMKVCARRTGLSLSKLAEEKKFG